LTNVGLEVVSLEAAQGDFIFEIEITSNRPDWLSVLGVAREVAAITGKKLTSLRGGAEAISEKGLLRPFRARNDKTRKSVNQLTIKIEDKKDCPFYTARIIKNVKVGSSPEWLRKRLELVGCRSVNNIVDITNYCLFALGHPLHAFDLDKLNKATIIVRRAKAGEKITTIDNQQKLLTPEILVIADNHKPVAIAGVMGGKDTEVTSKTCNILLESAIFNPILVRRGRQKLGLQSESAYRFERGVDLESAKNTSLLAQKLICELAHGKPRGKKSLGVFKPAYLSIKLDIAYVNRILGTKITTLKAKQILSSLGFSLKTQTKNILLVKVPSFRQDIKSAIDLVEEVARIYGYAAIAQTLPAIKPGLNTFGKTESVSYIKNVLLGLGLQEAITYSLVDRQLLIKLGIKLDVNLVEISNPLSREQEVLRPTLLPSLMRCLAYNLNQQQEYVNIFEVANIFSGSNNVTQHPALSDEPVRASAQHPALSDRPVRASAQHPALSDEPVRASAQEELSLGIALCGTSSFLIKQGLIKDEITLLHLKGILEELFNKLGIQGYGFKSKGGKQISIIVGEQEVGVMLDLNKQVLDAFDIKNKQVVLAEINLEKIFTYINLKKKFSNIPRYPAITRDISFIVKDDISVKDLIWAIEEKGLTLLSLAKVVDYYQGKQIPAGFRGLTVSCVYRAPDRTLTEEELSPIHNSICAFLVERFGIKLR
ncbi:MAG: phenylalanine--tRNA ligase subunit beta, partial [Candidatus Omnitrophica bacterium]|nr:phenylalanine--tRNA ligase subunit beta [Candidatus Omnitrophota bacterium]